MPIKAWLGVYRSSLSFNKFPSLLLSMQAEFGFNEHHQNEVINYMRFARSNRVLRLKTIDSCFEELKESRWGLFLHWCVNVTSDSDASVKCATSVCLQAGGGNLHCGRSEGNVGRAAGCGSWWGGDGTDQHCAHQRAATQAAFLTGWEVLPPTPERYLRAGEQVSWKEAWDSCKLLSSQT